MICHRILNMQETKYVVEPMEEILRNGMQHGFERVYIVYEPLTATVIFLLMQSCIFYYINVYILITLYVYVCRWNMKRQNIKNNLVNKTIS